MRFAVFCLIACATGAALAEDRAPASNPALAPPPNAAPVAGADWKLSGQIDAYYMINPSGADTTAGRAFDDYDNRAALNLVGASAERKFDEVLFHAEAAFGEFADRLAMQGSLARQLAAGGTNPAASEPTRNIPQAVLAYSPRDVPGLTVTAGKFFTPIGFETPYARDNWNYSRGLLFTYASPIWHQGLVASYQVFPDIVTASFGGVNSWDGRLAAEKNKTTSLLWQVQLTPFDGLSFSYAVISGPEGSSGDQDAIRSAHEFNGMWSFAEGRAALAFDVISGKQKRSTSTSDASWLGWAAYARGALVPWHALALRYESLDDKDQGAVTSAATPFFGGSSASKQTVTSFTVTNSFKATKNLEARLEARFDRSDNSSSALFLNSAGGGTDNQTTWTLAALFGF